MFAKPLRASDFRIVSFQAGDEDSLDEEVNKWLSQQSIDIVVYDMMFGHATACQGDEIYWSFAVTIVYGNKPRSSGASA